MVPKLNERICLVGHSLHFLGSMANAFLTVDKLRNCLLYRFVRDLRADTISCIPFASYKDAYDRIAGELRSLVIIEVKYRDDIKTIDEIRFGEGNDMAALPVIAMSFSPLRKFTGTILEEYSCNCFVQIPFTLDEFACALDGVMAYDPDEILYVRRAYYSLSGLIDRVWHGAVPQNCREKLTEIENGIRKFSYEDRYEERFSAIEALISPNLTQKLVNGRITPAVRDLMEQVAEDEKQFKRGEE